MGESVCKYVHLASSNLPCVPLSLKATLCGGVTLCRSNMHSNVETFGHGLVYTSSLNPVNITIEICKNILNA